MIDSNVSPGLSALLPFNMSYKNRHAACFVAFISAALCGIALAVQVPYSDNFDSYATGSTPANFTTGLNTLGNLFNVSSWSVNNATGTSGSYGNSLSGQEGESSAGITVDNLDHADFVLSTTLVIAGSGMVSPPSLIDTRVGLGALGSGPNFPDSGYQLSYEVEYNGSDFGLHAGRLTIYEANQAIGGSSVLMPLPVVTGIVYTMTLTGTYTTTGLLLTGTISDGTSSISGTALDATPQTGNYFGYYDFAAGQVNKSVSLGVSYDNFSISVPERRTVSLLVCAVTVLGLWRKRKAVE